MTTKAKPVAKRGLGRPSKLTPAVAKRIFAAIRKGCPFQPACRAAGISYDALNDWMRKGREQPDSDYGQFLHALEQAEAEAEARLVGLWAGKAPTDWKAARDLLERRHPERWRRREEHQLTGAGGGDEIRVRWGGDDPPVKAG